MRWLFVKDVQILRRSPLLLTLLVIYPIVISVLIGFALSRGPDKPRVAFLNLAEQGELELGGETINLSDYADTLFESIDPVTIDCEGRDPEECEQEALDKVRDGDVLAALVIPEDITQRLQALQSLQAVEPPTVNVYFNAEDPVKARYVEDTIKSQAQDANAALTKKLTEAALSYLDLIVEGGEISLPILGGDIDVLGLERSNAIVQAAQAQLPPNSEAHRQLDEVIRFSELAQENLDLSDEILNTIGTPVEVETQTLDGDTTPLSSFAVAVAVAISLMFVTVLLAAGTLALEREENAFRRLIRGLVSPTAPAGREGAAGRRVCGPARDPDAVRAGAVRRPRLGPLPALGRGARRRVARVRGARARGRRARARGPRRVAPRVHARPADRLPRPRSLRRGLVGALRRHPGDLRALPVRPDARGDGRGAERRRRHGGPAASTWPLLTLGFGALARLALRRFD